MLLGEGPIDMKVFLGHFDLEILDSARFLCKFRVASVLNFSFNEVKDLDSTVVGCIIKLSSMSISN